MANKKFEDNKRWAYVPGFREFMVNELSTAAEAIEKIDDDVAAVITEDNFVTGYLNMLIGLSRNGADKNIINSPAYEQWMKLTDNGRTQVKVVSNTNNEEVLFLVPPLYVAPFVDYDKVQASFDNLANTPQNFQYYLNYLPIQGISYLDDVTRKLESCVGGQEDYTSKWLEIFNRYKNGYNGSSTTDNKPNTNKSNTEESENVTEGLW
jgi:hypothetical protein